MVFMSSAIGGPRFSMKLRWILRATVLTALSMVSVRIPVAADDHPWDRWEAIETGVSNVLRGVGFANGVWVATGDEYASAAQGSESPASIPGVILASNDGRSWHLAATLPVPSYPIPPRHGPGGWLVVNGRRAFRSQDGTQWSERQLNLEGGGQLSAVESGGGRWIGIGKSDATHLYAGAGLWSSEDGESWRLRLQLQYWVGPPAPVPAPDRTFRALAYGDGRWLATHTWLDGPRHSGAGIHTSEDGIVWTQSPLPGENAGQPLLRAVHGNGIWRLFELGNRSYLSTNARTWVTATTPQREYPGSVAWGGGSFCLLGPKPLNQTAIATTDSTAPDGTWSIHPITHPLRPWYPLNGVAFGDGRWLVASSDGVILRSDPVTTLMIPLLSTSPPGRFLGQLRGPPGQRHQIQFSSNLIGWVDLPGASNVTDGEMFSDPIPEGQPLRVYRAVPP